MLMHTVAEILLAVARYDLALPLDVCKLSWTHSSTARLWRITSIATSRNWSLVYHAWCVHTQSLFFRISELASSESVGKFSTHRTLDSAPHLVLYARPLRAHR